MQHDIDRTQTVFETDGLEAEQYEGVEETSYYGETVAESPFDEVEESELATQLLEVTDEDELDQFLGNVFKKVARVAGKVIRSPVGQALGGILKKAAKQALPIAGGALGTFIGGPLGGRIGSTLASKAGSMLGLELEGLSAEDQEFEVARQVVRLAGAAAQKAAGAPPSVPPNAAARAAFVAAAKQFAPGMVRPGMVAQGAAAIGGGRSGRWIRRGRKIVLFGV
jgi:hypothetical protein